MTAGRAESFRRLSRLEAERRGRAGLGEPCREEAVFRDVAVHDAVRLLGLVPAAEPESGYDAHDPEFRYRIAGCAPADSFVAAGAFRPGPWDRGLLVSMTPDLEPLTIHELTFEAARATRSAARLRSAGRSRWVRR